LAQGVHPGAPKGAWGSPLANRHARFLGRDFSNGKDQIAIGGLVYAHPPKAIIPGLLLMGSALTPNGRLGLRPCRPSRLVGFSGEPFGEPAALDALFPRIPPLGRLGLRPCRRSRQFSLPAPHCRPAFYAFLPLFAPFARPPVTSEIAHSQLFTG
jgi:hypothetical protein